MRDKGFWGMGEWTLKDKREHYLYYESAIGLIRLRCRHCEYVVIAERSQALLALNIMRRHLKDVHNIEWDQAVKA